MSKKTARHYKKEYQHLTRYELSLLLIEHKPKVDKKNRNESFYICQAVQSLIDEHLERTFISLFSRSK
jgi:hypothetical protein